MQIKLSRRGAKNENDEAADRTNHFKTRRRGEIYTPRCVSDGEWALVRPLNREGSGEQATGEVLVTFRSEKMRELDWKGDMKSEQYKETPG